MTAVGGGMEVRLSIRDVRNCRGFGMDEVIISVFGCLDVMM